MKRQRTKISPGIKKKGKRILAAVLAVVLVSPYGYYKMPATVKADAPEQTLESVALEAVSEAAVPEIKAGEKTPDAIEGTGSGTSEEADTGAFKNAEPETGEPGTEAAAPETEDPEPEKPPQRAEDPTGPATPQTERESNVLEETCICTEPCTEGTVNMDCPVCSAEGADLAKCEGRYQAAVTLDGTTTEYATLLEALNAANKKNATVTMLHDVTDETGKDCFWRMTGGNVTFDMNGHTLICQGFRIEDDSFEGMLTITGNGNFQSTGGQGVNVNSGDCTIENGTFSIISEVKSFLIGSGRDNVLTIKGGTFKNSYVNIAGPRFDQFTSTISGGTFDELKLDSGINLKMTGGKFGKIDGTNISVNKYLAGGYAFYDYTEKQWVTDPAKLSAASIEHVEVKRIPVSISVQPQDKTVYYSQWTEKLEATAQTVDGAGPVSYQWYRVGTGADGGDEAISGAAEVQFRIPRNLDAGTHDFYCIATCDGYPAKSNTATVTVLQSGIDLGEIKAYLKRYLIPEEQTIFTGGQTIMVMVTPKATGKAPAVMARTAAAEPASGQMALYDEEGNQIGPAVDASASGTYWMEVDSTELGVGVHVLTVKYVGGPNVASAEGTVEVTVVPAARIGSQVYFMLEDAWAYAKENSSEGNPVTVTLLTDVEVSSELTVESGEHIILTSEPDKNYMVSSTINESKKGTIRMSGGIFELWGGTVKSPGNGYGIFLLGGSAFLRGGSITGMYGIYLEEDLADARVEIFSGFVMRVSNYGIEAWNGGELIINGGQMEAGNTCVYVRQGVTVHISRGIIKSYLRGRGLDVSGNSSALVELSGGTFTGSDSSPSISVSNTSNVKSILAEEKAYYRGDDTTGELITEGMDGMSLLETVTVGDCTHSYGEWTAAEDGHSKTCVVCGDTVTEPHNVTGWTDLQDGTHAGVCTDCGSTIVASHIWDGSNPECPDCQIAFAASVENNGTETMFAAIEQAWAYAKEQSTEEKAATVMLLVDAEVSESLTVENGNHIILTCLDGAEYTLSGSIQISGGSFELAGGTISYDSGKWDDCSTIYVTGGRAILRGGTIISKLTYGVDLVSDSKGEVEISSGCVVTGEKEGVWALGGRLLVKGGQITGRSSAGIYARSSSVEISGGIIEGGKVGLQIAVNVSAKLSGGTFKGEAYSIVNQVYGENIKDILAEGCGYYDADSQYIAVTEATRDLTEKEVTVKNPDVVSYTISIPQTAIAGGEPVNIVINQEQTFNLNGGTVSVSVSDGIDESGRLTLTDKANAINTVTSALYVQQPGETEEQPMTSYENGVFASFTKADDPAVALSFKEPTENNIPIGTYEGNVTFSIDYTEAPQ